MRASVLLSVGSMCLVAATAHAANFPGAVTDGIGVSANGEGFTLEQARRLRAAGVRVVRADLASFIIDRIDDDGNHVSWSFDTVDALVENCAKAGLRVYGILNWGSLYCPSSDFGVFDPNGAFLASHDYGPCAWKCYGTADFRNRVDDYIYNTVYHFTLKAYDLVTEPGTDPSWNPNFTWELWNEPNSGAFWPSRPSTTIPDTNPPVPADLNFYLAQSRNRYPGYSPQQYYNCTQDDLTAEATGDDSERMTTAAEQYMQLAVGVDGDTYPEGALQIIRDASAAAFARASSHPPYATQEIVPTIVAPGVATPEWMDMSTRYLTTCFDKGLLDNNSIDGLSGHFYRLGNPETVVGGGPETVNPTSNYAGIRARMGAGSDTIPIISGEWGYTLAPSWHLTPQMQADDFQRMMLTNFSMQLPDGSPAVPVSIWYQDEDRPNDDPEWYFGLFEYNEWNVYGDPKPAFYAAKTLTSNLKGARFHGRYAPENVPVSDYLMLFRTPRWDAEKEMLAAWTTNEAGQHTVRDDPWWGSFMVTGTPMYLGSPLVWNGSSSWLYGFGEGWPNEYTEHSDNWQAKFDQVGTVNVDGEYFVSGLQFNAPSRVPVASVTLQGGKLKFTPGGGNLYVGDGFNIVASEIADAYDRGTEPLRITDPDLPASLAFSNTPETFVLRKSGWGEVGLVGYNTFHGSVLVGQGFLDLGNRRALGDPSNPVTLAGGGIDLNGYNPTTGPLTVIGDSTIVNYGAVVSTYIPQSFDITNGNLTVDGGATAIIFGSNISIGMDGALTVQGSARVSANSVVIRGGALYENASSTFSDIYIDNGGTLGGVGSARGTVYVSNGHLSPGVSPALSAPLSSIGILSVEGNVSIAAGSSMDIDFRRSSHDLLTMNGYTLSLGGKVKISGTSLPTSGKYPIVTGAYDIVYDSSSFSDVTRGFIVVRGARGNREMDYCPRSDCR